MSAFGWICVVIITAIVVGVIDNMWANWCKKEHTKNIGERMDDK